MTPQQIINNVASYYGITPRQLINGDRHRMYSDPRHVAAYLMHKSLRLGYSTIGRMMGKRHATIIYACNKVGAWMEMPVLNPHAVGFINNKLTDKTVTCD